MGQSVNTNAPWYTGSNGATNYTRSEAQRFARELVEDPQYRLALKARMLRGDLNASMEALLWYYAYGKPREEVALTVTQGPDLSSLSLEELQKRARELSDQLEEAAQVKNAIPAQYRVM